MHCPKCGQNYPDGFQRFCDTDGSRLVPDTSNSRTGVSVFASILNKTGSGKREETVNEIPDYLSAEDRRAGDAERRKDEQMRAMFFDQDAEPELTGDIFVIEDAPTTKPPARHIDPNQIPAGHVDLVERGLLPINLNEFDIDDPAGFVGKTVKGRYRVTEMLGEDDTGFAYLGEDRIVGDKRVIVRILTNEYDEDEITSSIYAEERVSLSHINHPNVARLFDSGSYTNGTTYLISEHLDGLTVDDILLIHGQFSPTRTAKIVRQAAYALSEVHHEGILHRDIRPANISVAPSEIETEIVKVANFGVANGYPNAANLAYQAPETLDGRIPTVASDIYSLAIVAYEMLTGKTPFDGNTERELQRSQRNGLTKPLVGFGGGINSVFEKALSFDPRERYVTARDFGDAFYASATAPAVVPVTDNTPEYAKDVEIVTETETIVATPPIPALLVEEKVEEKIAEKPAIVPVIDNEPAWTRRSPDPIAEPNSGWLKIAGVAFATLLTIVVLGWYYLFNKPVESNVPATNIVAQNTNSAAIDTIVPPLERHVPQPPNTDYFQSSKQNLRGDLIRNFVGFKLYYPKDWKVNGAKESTSAGTRGKFLDISKSTPEGRLKEQMLISYYPSNGTITDDAKKFPQMVKETNETLKKLLPGYQVVSEGPINVNGDWKAYEVKFQGSGTSDTGERLLVWGRRLFIPAARPGVRNGFEITMLATSYADDVHSVDDIGVRGELASILDTFEPSQNF